MDLANMSVEEFMKADWGAENSDAEDELVDKEQIKDSKENPNQAKVEPAKKKKRRKRKPKNKNKPADDRPDHKVKASINEKSADDKKDGNKSSHQNALDRLKEKDPEFYDFLQQEDSTLLNFDVDAFDLDASSEEDDEEVGGVHKLPPTLEEASDSDIDYDSDVLPTDSDDASETSEVTKRKKTKQQITVTEDLVEKWKAKLMDETPKISTLRSVTRAFHAAIARFSQDDAKKSKKKKRQLNFKVENSSAFNAVVGLCIRHVVPSLAKLLNYHPEKSSKKQALPSQCKDWGKVRELLRTYLTDVIELNQLLLEPTVVCATLRHTILLMPYFVSFPKITKVLLKFLVKSWSSSDDESVRVLSFLCINRIVKLDRKRYLDQVLKQTYFAYVANCKFTTPTLLPMINFMQQTLCELFAIDTATTYQLSFLYIRQLAIHLRKAMTVHKKENYQAVYNWQYVHCLGLWCRMVGKLYSDESIKSLLYPLVQVSLGTIDLVPTPRYFPLRYHIIKYLTSICEATNVYIPLFPYITRPLRLAELSKKKSGSSIKPLSFSTILKLSNSQLKEASYRASTMNEVYYALMEYINTQAHTISFPEMMVPTTMVLKKFAKNCKVPSHAKLARQIVEKVDENGKFILQKRSSVSFAVTDIEAVARWESGLKEQGVPFHKQYAHYKKLRQAEEHQEAADKDRIVEERLPMVDRKKFMELSKKKDREELGKLFGDEDDDDEAADEMEADFESIIEQGRKSKARKPNVEMEDEDSSDLGSDEADSDDEEEEDDAEDDESEEESVASNAKQSLKGLKRTNNNNEEGATKKQVKLAENEDPDIVEDFHFSSDEEK